MLYKNYEIVKFYEVKYIRMNFSENFSSLIYQSNGIFIAIFNSAPVCCSKRPVTRTGLSFRPSVKDQRFDDVALPRERKKAPPRNSISSALRKSTFVLPARIKETPSARILRTWGGAGAPLESSRSFRPRVFRVPLPGAEKGFLTL